MNENLKDSIPASVRKVIYWAFIAATAIVGGAQAYVGAIGIVQPDWITGTLAVLAYLGALLGLQAVVYTPKTKSAVSASEDLELPTEGNDTQEDYDELIDPATGSAGAYAPIESESIGTPNGSRAQL